MKRIISLAVGILLLLSMLGACGRQPPDHTKPTNNTQPPATTEVAPKPNVLYVGTGKISDEKLEQAIKEYQENYTPFVSDGTNGTSVSFETDFEISSVSVPLLSKVDDRDIDIERRGYIDLVVETMHVDKRFMVSTDWWYGSGSNTKAYPVWSYLVYVKDTAGTVHYYYFRVKYSTPQDNIEYIE